MQVGETTKEVLEITSPDAASLLFITELIPRWKFLIIWRTVLGVSSRSRELTQYAVYPDILDSDPGPAAPGCMHGRCVRRWVRGAK